MNIIQQVLRSQEGNVKHTACVDVTYNSSTVKALVGETSNQREQTELGDSEYGVCRISVYKSDVSSINLKADQVTVNGVAYKPTSYEDNDNMWVLMLEAKTIVERTRENFRK